MRCFFFRMTISQRSRCVFRWMAQLYDRGVISRWEQRGSIAWFWPMACYRILRPYGRKYPPNIIYICDIYIYLSIYISFGYVYVMFECLARCTCKFTQPHTCITSFHRLRNKQMNEWMNERKKERMNTHAHIMYIYIDLYILRYIGYMLAVRNLMLQGLQGILRGPIQVPVSDYRAMRQAADPLDPKYEVRHDAAKLQRWLRHPKPRNHQQKTPENVTSLSKRHSVWSLIVLMIDLWNLWNLENHNHPAFFHLLLLKKIGPWYGQTIEVAARSLSASPWGWRCGMWSDSMPLGGNGGGCRKVCRRDGGLKIEIVHISRFPAFLSILRLLYVYIHNIYIYTDIII